MYTDLLVACWGQIIAVWLLWLWSAGCPWRLQNCVAIFVYCLCTIVLTCVSSLFHHWTTHLSFPTTWLALSWLKRWQRSAIVILLVVVRHRSSHPIFLLDTEVVSFPAFFLWQERNLNAVDMNSHASLQHRMFHHLCWLTALANHCSVCSFLFVTTPGCTGRARCCHAEMNSCSRGSHSVCTFNPWKVPSLSVSIVMHSLNTCAGRSAQVDSWNVKYFCLR